MFERISRCVLNYFMVVTFVCVFPRPSSVRNVYEKAPAQSAKGRKSRAFDIS